VVLRFPRFPGLTPCFRTLYTLRLALPMSIYICSVQVRLPEPPVLFSTEFTVFYDFGSALRALTLYVCFHKPYNAYSTSLSTTSQALAYGIAPHHHLTSGPDGPTQLSFWQDFRSPPLCTRVSGFKAHNSLRHELKVQIRFVELVSRPVFHQSRGLHCRSSTTPLGYFFSALSFKKKNPPQVCLSVTYAERPELAQEP